MTKRIKDALKLDKQIRVIGFDDSPFEKKRGSPVNICGVVCADTRFEGMLWGEISKDGRDATEILIKLVQQSKFHQQLHVILLDGIGFGGFNIIDLPMLAQTLELPCIAVMRRPPDLAAISQALDNFDDAGERRHLLKLAGPVHEQNSFVFQVAGMDSADAALLLARVTDTGKVPEALRIAHLIGGAVKTGESGNRA